MAPTDTELLKQISEVEKAQEVTQRDILEHLKVITKLTADIETLLGWRVEQKEEEARQAERDKALHTRLNHMEKAGQESRDECNVGIRSIKDTWTRVQWIVITAVLGGGILYAINHIGLVP